MITTRNEDGEWVPAIPLPFIGFFYVRCWKCNLRNWGRYTNAKSKYNQHYKETHL